MKEDWELKDPDEAREARPPKVREEFDSEEEAEENDAGEGAAWS